ncbi:MAG: hypothetical protein AB7S38_25515 [Vulcanimicrobiota bacterium]
MKPLLITANSPGEISGWMQPVLRRYRQAFPEARVVVLLLPCTFASGNEARVAGQLEGVSEVIPASRIPALLAYEGRRFAGCSLLHLGGDLMYTAVLSWRWGLRCWSYLWARPWWDSAFVGYFTKNQWGVDWLLKRKVAPEKIRVVGDLVVDGVYQTVSPQRPDHNLISFLPGSREQEATSLIPFFLGVAARLKASHPQLEFQFHLSPYLDRPEGSQFPVDPALGGVAARLEGGYLVTEQLRAPVRRQDSLEHLARARLAVAIPGTKTAEAGSLGVPSLCLLPLNRPQDLPYIGLLGLLDWVPGARAVKSRILLNMRDTIGLFSQPNQLASEALIPELVEVIRVETVAELIEDLIKQNSHLDEVRARLLDLYGPYAGAAEKVVSTISGQTLP